MAYLQGGIATDHGSAMFLPLEHLEYYMYTSAVLIVKCTGHPGTQYILSSAHDLGDLTLSDRSLVALEILLWC